jgi:hypothetical protein
MKLQQEDREFLLAEYTDRRAYFQFLIQQVDQDQRYALIATGAFWGWIVTHAVNSSYIYMVWIPTILTFGLLGKWLVFRTTILRLARYIKHIEVQFSLPDGVGWASNYRQYGRDLLGPFTTCFWCALLVLNVAAAFTAPLIPPIPEAK